MDTTNESFHMKTYDFSIYTFLHKNYVHALNYRYLKYWSHVQAIYRDMTS